MKNRQKTFALVMGLLSALASSTAWTDTINYGNYCGQHLSFFNVTETTLQPGMLPYGAPTAISDQLDFDMPHFQRQADAAPGGPFPVTSFLNGQLSLVAEADPGYDLVSVTISAGGTYSAFGPDAFARSFLNAKVRQPGATSFDSGSFTFLSSPTQGFGVNSGSWSGNMTITFDPTSQIQFDLDTQLLAFAGTSNYGTAFINAEYLTVNFGNQLTTVPEPSSGLLIAGIVGFVMAAHRRRRRPMAIALRTPLLNGPFTDFRRVFLVPGYLRQDTSGLEN